MAQEKFLTFWNGIKMPAIGYGTWRVSVIHLVFFLFTTTTSTNSTLNTKKTFSFFQAPDEEIERALNLALEAGYR